VGALAVGTANSNRRIIRGPRFVSHLLIALGTAYGYCFYTRLAIQTKQLELATVGARHSEHWVRSGRCIRPCGADETLQCGAWRGSSW